MLTTIKLDDQSRRMASKISNVRTYANLAPEVCAWRLDLSAKVQPELSFGIRRLGTHSTREDALRRRGD
jgi:hypothetical protein